MGRKKKKKKKFLFSFSFFNDRKSYRNPSSAFARILCVCCPKPIKRKYQYALRSKPSQKLTRQRLRYATSAGTWSLRRRPMRQRSSESSCNSDQTYI
ncbi:hypothetical protein Phum_PHUM515980 [Pediculus humanus corporis]|uniref:Uncharacterized protein n=1 Tax=Pediculus humanus subsp. corporis TaxID=121224 RepID=E0VYM8_PEDHC|nr:uncharacterized protein Phum_PHUM515980 [Pediculus humanus corporis]EEB18484.1 hypothetical protein Phum_PHUM515980 [Pediculus humanus corporis]